MTKVHFDTEKLISDLDAQRSAQMAAALERATTEAARAFVMAQHALFPAFAEAHRVFIELRGAGHADEFVARAMGALAGNMLANCAVNSRDPQAASMAFQNGMLCAAANAMEGNGVWAKQHGTPGGTA